MDLPERGPKGIFQKKDAAKKRKKPSEIAVEAKQKKAISLPDLPGIVIGARLVDIGHISKEMWCSTCDTPLSLRFIVKEVFQGLSAIFHVQCQQCSQVYEVSTLKKVGKNSKAQQS